MFTFLRPARTRPRPNGSLRNWGGTPFNSIGGGDGTTNLIDPANQNKVYSCSQNGACTRSTNSAASWTAISPDLTRGSGGVGGATFGTVTALAVARSNSQVIYAGTDHSRVWITRNTGGTWTEITAGLPTRWITRIEVDPASADTAYASVSGYRNGDPGAHVFKTTTGGTSWQDISAGLPDAPVNDLTLDPRKPAVLYAAGDVGVFARAADGTWSPVGSGLPLVPGLRPGRRGLRNHHRVDRRHLRTGLLPHHHELTTLDCGNLRFAGYAPHPACHRLGSRPSLREQCRLINASYQEDIVINGRQLRRMAVLGTAIILAPLLSPARPAAAEPRLTLDNPTFTGAAAFDRTAPLRDVVRARASARASTGAAGPTVGDMRPDDGPAVANRPYAGDPSVQRHKPKPVIPGTKANFEGLSNQDNFNVLGIRVNPPDPVGDVGPNHYVEMINLVFGVYSKTGTLLLGPVDTGTLWAGFPIDECTEPSGDPIVIYDQFADRWILTQFTTRGLDFPDEPANPFYNCVAISTTGDPTGSYYRYAFTTGFNFPDYPKYSVWDDSYLITTREFGIVDASIYGIGVYGLERERMIAGDPAARAVSFLLQDGRVPINLIGDGLLPADADGKKPPKRNSTAPIIGSQDDEGPYGATFDALNVWEFDVKWNAAPTASIALATQLAVDEFDSAFPCAPTARDCLPQPGITDPNQYLDILSYRQRPTWRLAHRTFGDHEAMVTNQSVEALPGIAGVRWWEVRRTGNGRYRVFQQGTFAPDDGVHRWMGSIAMDRKGNAALGYSVVNGVDIFPGIRYTGRLAGDRRGQMTLGEATVVNGTAAQTSLNSRWGDYTSMNVDPVDDCTFWYVNEYYTVAGAATAPAGNGWQTRIASFKLPGC